MKERRTAFRVETEDKQYAIAWHLGAVENRARDRVSRAESALEGLDLVREIGIKGLSIKRNVRPDLRREIERGSADIADLCIAADMLLPDVPGFQRKK